MNNNIYSRISPLIFTNFLLAVIAGSMLWNIAGSSVESMAQAQSRELTDLEGELDRRHAEIMLQGRLDAVRRNMDRYEKSQRRLDSPRQIASLERTHSLKRQLMEAVEAGRMSQEEADREFSDFIDRMARKERAYAERGIMDRDIEALLLERIRRDGRMENDEEIMALLYEIEMNTRR